MLCCLSVSIQPFADVVANYISSYRNQKRYNYFHMNFPPSCWKESTAFIAYHIKITPTIWLVMHLKIFSFLESRGNPKGDGIPFWWGGIGSDERPLPRAKP